MPPPVCSESAPPRASAARPDCCSRGWPNARVKSRRSREDENAVGLGEGYRSARLRERSIPGRVPEGAVRLREPDEEGRDLLLVTQEGRDDPGHAAGWQTAHTASDSGKPV